MAKTNEQRHHEAAMEHIKRLEEKIEALEGIIRQRGAEISRVRRENASLKDAMKDALVAPSPFVATWAG